MDPDTKQDLKSHQIITDEFAFEDMEQKFQDWVSLRKTGLIPRMIAMRTDIQRVLDAGINSYAKLEEEFKKVQSKTSGLSSRNRELVVWAWGKVNQ